jgi:RNA polymerase sigma-70 factor (ECF subfamily)
MAEDRSIERMLEGARGGDRSQLGHLFEACRSYLGVLARAQVEPWLQAKVDASDIVQETLLEAHRDFGRFHGKTAAEWLAWLREILSHNAADYVRRYGTTEKRQARREVSLGARPDGSDASSFACEPADPGASPSQQAICHERELHLANALAKLAPDYQEVIMLRNLQRLPFDEVARRMGRSRPAVQMLWMRAVRKLQQEMTDTL